MNMKRECLREYLKNQGDKTLKAKDNGSLNLLNPKIEIWILFYRPCSFPTEVVENFDKISSKFILGDRVRNSHDRSV